jgi:hypothetical protein
MASTGRRSPVPSVLHLGKHLLDQQAIDVVASEMCVPVGGENLEHAVLDLQDRDVEGASAKVVHRDRSAIRLSSP